MVGVPQVFLRLSGCNLRCSYCDTPEAWERVERCTVYGWKGEKERIANPIDVAETGRLVAGLWDRSMHSVSITGGEPLLQARELSSLLPMLKGGGMDIYLETNGTLAEGLELVLPWVDWIAMDIKLPSTQGGEDLIPLHRGFIARVPPGKLFLKAVVDAATGEEELARACEELSGTGGGTTLVLQPATLALKEAGITPQRAFELQRMARDFFEDVRVIPQTHLAWGAK